MTSCLAPVSSATIPTISTPSAAAAMPLLKRVRSPSLAAVDRPLDSLKACKRDQQGADRELDLSAAPAPAASMEMPRNMSVNMTMRPTQAPWPRVEGCEGLRNAILFLENSKQHAKLLMLQNHWDRAINVLEKVEKANESVCSQRRRLVLAQANQIRDMTTAMDTTDDDVEVESKRAVRFCEDVQVVPIEDVDRTSWEVESPVREEMLVLRASRAIPNENMSELWQ